MDILGAIKDVRTLNLTAQKNYCKEKIVGLQFHSQMEELT